MKEFIAMPYERDFVFRAGAEKGHGAVGEQERPETAIETDAVEAVNNALDFTAESLYKRIHD